MNSVQQVIVNAIMRAQVSAILLTDVLFVQAAIQEINLKKGENAMSNMRRRQLDDEEVKNVSGGNLQVNVNDNGEAFLLLVNPDMTVANVFKILTDGEDVYAEIMEKYYNLPGNKDIEMLKILKSEGKI